MGLYHKTISAFPVMKILFLGDYSNLHACLAAELSRKGHDVTVVSDKGGYMNTYADFKIARSPGIIGGFKYLNQLFTILPQLKGYDAVQLINPNFLSLRPGKIKYFFDRIKQQNNRVFLSLAGNDYFFVKACADGRMFRYSEFKVGDEPTEFYQAVPQRMNGWIAEHNRIWNSYVYENIDGAMSVLPEYDMAARPLLGSALTFTNLPVDLSYLPFSPLSLGEGPLRIFIGIRAGMEIQKGTERMLAEVRELEKEMPGKVEVECVRNLPLDEYLKRMAHSHLVLDQLYSYSPATNALQAMALGRVAGSGAQQEYYDYITHDSSRPIFSLSPLEAPLKERLRELVIDPSPLVEMGREGRKIVERHNDVRIVADRFLNVWQK